MHVLMRQAGWRRTGAPSTSTVEAVVDNSSWLQAAGKRPAVARCARVAPSTHLLEPRCLLDYAAGRRVAGQGLPGCQPVRHLPLQGSRAGVYVCGLGRLGPVKCTACLERGVNGNVCINQEHWKQAGAPRCAKGESGSRPAPTRRSMAL